MDHELLEESINLVRAARAAGQALRAPGGPPTEGAVATFPVSVLAPAAGATEHRWSFRVDHEPGGVFPPGVTQVRFRGRISGVAVSGRFHVVVGEVEDIPPATLVTAGEVRPPWATQMPGNIALPALSPAALRRTVARLARQEVAATERVLTLALPFLDHLADTFTPQLRHRRSTIDRQDLVSEGWKRAYQVLDRFAGPDRPDVAWSTALYRNCRRDMSRAVHALDGTSEAVATIRAAHAAHPELREPAELARELAVQAAERVVAANDPHLAADERRQRAEATAGPCRFTLGQIELGMRLPRVMAWQDLAGANPGQGEEDDADGLPEERWGGWDDTALSGIEDPAIGAAIALSRLTPAVGRGRMADLLADLGLDPGPLGPGQAAAADLGRVRRRLLAPFILPGEATQSRAVLDRAGRRARSKLVVDGQLLTGDRLQTAWQAGISAEEAHAIDGRLIA